MPRRVHPLLPLTFALAFLAPLGLAPTAWAQSPAHRTVLTVHWSSEDFTVNPIRDAALRKVLLSSPDVAIDYYAEYLESDRFPAEEASLALRNYIAEKFRGRHIDLVLAMQEPALQFVLKYRAELFPDAPIVYLGFSWSDASGRTDAPITGVVPAPRYDQTLGLALSLHPATERVLVVAHMVNPEFDRTTQASLASFEGRVKLDDISDKALPELLAAVKAAPPRSLVYYIRYSQEDPGQVRFPEEVLAMVAKTSPVPVYVSNESYMGSGVVGGMVDDTQSLAARAAEMALQILSGTQVHDIPFIRPSRTPVFDWRQLRRWRISESGLPAGSRIMFRQPGVWDLYKPQIIGATALLTLQAGLIVALLVQRVRRRRVADALVKSEAVLQASNREIQDLAGRLIASQEAERARIARDLHDDLSQQIAGLSIALSSVKRRVSSVAPDTSDLVGDVSSLQQRTLTLAEDIRNLSHDLHPSALQHAGLVAALTAHCAQLESQQSIAIAFTAAGEFGSITPPIALCLYRVAQEGLRNVVTHARASRVDVRLEQSGNRVELAIADDGQGFATAQPGKTGTGLGLVSINERVRLVGGVVNIATEPGKGTRLQVQIPLAAPALTASEL